MTGCPSIPDLGGPPQVKRKLKGQGPRGFRGVLRLRNAASSTTSVAPLDVGQGRGSDAAWAGDCLRACRTERNAQLRTGVMLNFSMPSKRDNSSASSAGDSARERSAAIAAK